MSIAPKAWGAMLALVAAAPALGQTAASNDPEVARIRVDFEYGKFPEVLQRATARIARGNLSEHDAMELHKYAGLSAYYLHQMPEAESHLWALLQFDPDYTFDPFVVPPPAIQYLESLRKQRSAQLESIREQRRLVAERLRVEAQELARIRAESELQRRRIEELSQQLNEAPVPKRSMLLNFVPFGVGQFQQKRTSAGVVFAATEGVFAATSIAAYFFYESLLQDQPVTVDDRLTPDRTFTFTVRGIPPEHHQQANVLRIVKYSSAGAFFLTYAIGVVDALIHQGDRPPLGASLPSGASSASSNQSPPATLTRQLVESARPYIAPVDGGMSAGLALRF